MRLREHFARVIAEQQAENLRRIVAEVERLGGWPPMPVSFVRPATPHYARSCKTRDHAPS